MSATEKSDLPEVAEKRANKAASAAAELVERRGGTKENAELQSTVRTQSRAAVSQAQARIREAVTRNRREKLTALLHHLTVDLLRASFFGLKKFAAPGVDEMTWTEYAKGLEENLSDLHSRVQTRAYRALPSRRTYIPKPDGRQRPLGIAALEDKIVQAAVVAILTPIYEAEFLGFSYGFRPKRNQHQALDALAFGIGRRRINWVLDCDVQSFFDKVSQSWLMRFIEHRIGDRRIMRLIAKWLTAHIADATAQHNRALAPSDPTRIEMRARQVQRPRRSIGCLAQSSCLSRCSVHLTSATARLNSRIHRLQGGNDDFLCGHV
jgi:RNA-directed DNA polymerase